MKRFIDNYRGDYGGESICRVIPIAPSTYYEQKARRDRSRSHSAASSAGRVLHGGNSASLG